jgi:hypothetical protein
MRLQRRLAPYPDDWVEFGDEILERLCGEALVIGTPRRLVE